MTGEVISQWMKKTGPDSDVVISSRIRLARNLENIRFTNQASDDELKEVIGKINNCLLYTSPSPRD